VLMKAGEKHAHGPLGFFALFSILWSLHWSAAISKSGREHVQPWKPSATLAAKYLLPLRRLMVILRQRAKLYRQIAAALGDLKTYAANSSERERWLFVTALESLTTHLYDFKFVAVKPEAFEKVASRLAVETGRITALYQDRARLQQVGERTNREIADLLVTAANEALPALVGASELLTDIKDQIVEPLAEKRKNGPSRAAKAYAATRRCR